MDTQKFDEWCICELFGHVRIAGKVTESDILGGHALLRIDIPKEESGYTTQFIGPSAIFRLTPCAESIARAIALTSHPEPVSPWEIPDNRQTIYPDRLSEFPSSNSEEDIF